MREFNLLACPLEGLTLIEASAGTGKTYSITGLFLRLLLQKKVPADRILVVTFTEAATREIRDRVRKGLLQMQARLEKGFGVQPDKTLDALHVALDDKAEAQKRVRLALSDFDAIPIHTIHSFCLRMLHEFAFESGARYDFRLLADWEAHDLSRRVAEDFWRTRFYGAPLLFLRMLFDRLNPPAPDDFLPFVKKSLLSPALPLLPASPVVSLLDFDARFNEASCVLSNRWAVSRGDIVSYLAASPVLSHRSYSARWVPQWAECLDRVVSGVDPLLSSDDTRKALDKFSYASVRTALKPGTAELCHLEFFKACGILRTLFDDTMTSLTLDFDLTGPEQTGLSRAERRHLLEAA